MERKATDQRRVWRLEAGLPEPTGTGPATRQLRPAGTGSGRLHRREVVGKFRGNGCDYADSVELCR